MKRLLAIFIFLFNFHKLNSQTKWSGLTLRVQGGIYIDYFGLEMEDGTISTPTGIDAMFGWGIEYSFIIKDNIYLSIDLGFPYFNTIFHSEEVKANPMVGDFKFPAFFLYFIPITYIHLGYVTKDWAFTIAPAYYWGLTSTIKKGVSNNVSLELRHTWFFDKLLYKDGLHDMHFLFSTRHTF